MARLGMDVALLAKLGTDARADAILVRATEEGVSSRWTKPRRARQPALPSPPARSFSASSWRSKRTYAGAASKSDTIEFCVRCRRF